MKKKTTKLISILLTLVMLLGLLPTTAFAVESTSITSINITGITAPVEGASPWLGLDEITTDTPGLEIESAFWYRDSALQNYPFEAGYTYNLTIHFDIDEGYAFSDSATVDHDLPGGTFSGKNLTIDTPWISIDYTIPASESTPIPFVKISGVTEPVIGATPDFDITLTGDGAALYEYDEEEWEAITWAKLNPGTGEWIPLGEDTPFGAGIYCLGVALEAEDGYEFTGATKFYYNEYELPAWHDTYESNYDWWADEGVDILLYFTLEDPAAPTEITSLSATVTEPVAGASPSFEAVAGGEGYTAEVEWESEDAQLYPEDGYEFKAGEKYYLYVAFNAKEGYEFTNSVTITINGKPAEEKGKNGDTVWGLVTYTLPADTTVTIEMKTGDKVDDFTGAAEVGLDCLVYHNLLVADEEVKGFRNKLGKLLFTVDDEGVVTIAGGVTEEDAISYELPPEESAAVLEDYGIEMTKVILTFTLEEEPADTTVTIEMKTGDKVDDFTGAAEVGLDCLVYHNLLVADVEVQGFRNEQGKLLFTVDDETGVVTIVDGVTEEDAISYELPPEESAAVLEDYGIEMTKVILTFVPEGSAAPTEITSLSATVTEPVAGASPSFEAIAGDEGYTVTVEWEDDDRQIYPEDDAKFEAGKQYFLAVEFSAKPGYVFAEDASVVINDKTPERKEVEETSAYGLLTFDLAAPVETYTVTFVTERGTAPGQQTITAGGKVSEPTAPAADGWTFGGWFADGNVSAWNFETDTVNANITLTAKWTEDAPAPQTATIVVKKWDSNQQPLAGATFTLSLPGSIQPAHTAVSDANGLVTFTDVADGSYTLAESEAPAGYVINDDTWGFVVRNGAVSDATGTPYDNDDPLPVINEIAPAPQTATIVVKKWDSNQQPLAGATFTLTLPGSIQPAYTAVSGEDGLVTFTDVEDGAYTLEETDAPAGYIMTDTTYQFLVDEGKVYIVENDDQMEYDNGDPLLIINEPLVTFTLPITKVVAKGGISTPGQQTFTFEIKKFGNDNFDVAAATIIENTITTNGVGSFDGVLKFSLAARDAEGILSEGLIIVEKNDGVANWTYDANEWEAFANYSRATSGGQWVFHNDDIAPNGAERATFTNTYTYTPYVPTPDPDPDPTPSTPVLNKVNHNTFLKGYSDGTFRPNQNMTRAQVTVMFARLLMEKMDVGTTYTNSFSDVPADHWAANEIGYMEKFGIIKGFSDGAFRPDAPITRAQFAAIACRFEELTEGTKTFSDVPADHWAAKYISYAAERGWVTGYEDGTFKPDAYITRAHVAAVTCRLLERTADQTYIKACFDELTCTFSDMEETDFAYWYVLEAANGHDYTKSSGVEAWTGLHK